MTRRSLRGSATLVVCVAIIVSAGFAAAAAAGGFGVPEYGPRRTGMGATIGRPDEPAAVYHNPAGLTLQHGLRLYASMGVALLSTEFQLLPWERSDEYLDDPIGADGYYPVTRPTRAMAVIPMLVATYEVVPDRWFAALSIYVNNATGARFERDAVTRYHLIDGYVVSPLIEASGAYRFGPRLSVGAGAGMMNVRIHGHRELYPIIDGSDLSVLLGSNAELTIDGSDWVPSWRIGVLGEPVPGLTLGAAVIGRADPVLSGPITIAYGDDAPAPETVLRGTAHTSLLLPWTFHAGANLDLGAHVEIGAELRWWLYRQYERQHTRIDDIFLIGELTTVKDYRDSIQVSGGVRVHDLPAAPGLELMLGTHHDRTPAPARTVTLDQPTFSHVGVRTGVRYARGRYRLGATWAHYWYDIPTIEDSITMPPSNVRGDGANDIFSLSLEAALERPR